MIGSSSYAGLRGATSNAWFDSLRNASYATELTSCGSDEPQSQTAEVNSCESQPSP
jgi:hypothetical protein